MEKLTGIIPTLNGEKYLEKAIIQLQKVCDEIIVIDSGSIDKTVEIAKKLNCKTFYNKYENYGKQCTIAAEKAENDWILINDQDEILTEDLINEIKNVKTNGFEYDVYIIKRNNYFLGKHIKHGGWGDEGETKLFNRLKARHTFENHATIKTKGKTGTFKHKANHYPYDNIKQFLDKVYNYADIASDEQIKKGKKFKLSKLFFNPFIRFIKKFFIQMGILDGFHGFILAVLSYYSVFLKYLRLWEKENSKN